tara:strand:+ start:208 stop:1176 length:969 start_codon:yes stop_codon:yes gene_type:complete
MIKKNILITGCAGFVGFHLSQRLCEGGYNVIGLDNLNDYYDVTLKKKRLEMLVKNKQFSFFKIDLCESSNLSQFFENNKIDFIIHLAAQAGVRYSLENPTAYIDSNIVGFMNILGECKKNNLNIIYASSSSVYGDSREFPLSEKEICKKPLSLYGATKLFNELTAYSYFNLYNISSIGLRFFTVYGPWGRPDMALFKFTKNILANKKIDVYNKGNHSRSFTYIDDIVDAIELLLENYIIKNNFYEILNIGGEKSIKLLEFINIIENKLVLKAKMNFMPKQLGDVEKTESDCSKIASLVNYQPKVSIEDGISNFIDWYKKYYL